LEKSNAFADYTGVQPGSNHGSY